MATSIGNSGGSTVLKIAKSRFPSNDGSIIESYSLPNFITNFNEEIGITNVSLKADLLTKIKKIQTQLKS